MKIFMRVISMPKQDYHARDQGARITICAADEAEANRLMEKMLPAGLDINAILFRSLIRKGEWQVFEAEGFTELTMTNGWKTVDFMNGKRAGLT